MENENITAHEAYRIAFETRNLEINLFWQRSNYFLVLNTALAVGAYTGRGTRYSYLLAVLGIIASSLWFAVNLGSKFWQARWEHRLSVFERDVAPRLNFFAADWTTIYDDVRASLTTANHKRLRRIVDEMILWKPSVTLIMTMLSLVFVIGWVAFVFIQAV